ncbi:hypothetical protein J6590_100460, partial [Homalodisca vitripennis]
VPTKHSMDRGNPGRETFSGLFHTWPPLMHPKRSMLSFRGSMDLFSRDGYLLTQKRPSPCTRFAVLSPPRQAFFCTLEEHTMSVIIVLRAVHTPRSFDLSHPVKILPEVAVPRQGLKQAFRSLMRLKVQRHDFQYPHPTLAAKIAWSMLPKCSLNCYQCLWRFFWPLLAGKIIRFCERVEGKDSYHNQALFSAGLPARVYHSEGF